MELERADRSRYLRRERLLKNRRIVSAYDLNPDRRGAYVALLNRYQPEYIYGYASALGALAEILRPVKDALHLRLKAVVSTAETLFPWQQDLLANVFSCLVANEYGARDAGILAYTCPCGKLHLTMENAIVEVLEPGTYRPVPVGSPGLLAVTDLNSIAQPRLRYLLGDVGMLSAEICPCGRSMPVLEELEGREDALLVGEGGKLVHGNFVNQILRRYEAVSQFQFVQHALTEATLYLVMEPDDGLVEQMLSELHRVLPNVTVAPEYVESIAPMPSGKLRYSVRDFPLQELLVKN